MRAALCSLLTSTLLLGACGGAVAVPTAVAATQSAPSATPAVVAAAPGVAWTVGAASKATVSVREQLVGVNAPSDAVLAATGAAGSFQLRSDGTFSPESKISFDLTTLTSNSRDRDTFVKRETLATSQFPKAELVPTKTAGLALPLASSGTFTFTLTGQLTIHGKAKEVTFDVQAKRDGSSLTATAAATPAFKFGDFGMSPPSFPFRVVSVVDEIRLAIELVASAQ